MFVAAHRGSRLHAPENSLHALLAGYTAGGEAIEFDLQLTLDGHVVLSHDGTIDRMTGLDGDRIARPRAQSPPGAVSSSSLEAEWEPRLHR